LTSRPAQFWNALAPATRGIVFMLGNTVLHGAMAYCVRMVADLHVSQIVFIRGIFVLAMIAPLALWRGEWRTNHLGLHLARGCGTFIGMSCFYWSYARLPLGEATALMFTMPLFLILLAHFVEHERVGWRRATATLIGFLGVLFVVKPGFGEFRPGLLVPLFMGFTDAVTVIFIKRLTRTETLLTIMFYMSAITFTISLVPAYLVWVEPSIEAVGVILLISVLTIATQLCYVSAFRAADMTAVAPVNYIQIPLAGLIGYVAFTELPDDGAVFGAAVIVGSTFYIARREARLRRMALQQGAKP
jgi:drug/metabolite transporter (DMT)-like permease